MKKNKKKYCASAFVKIGYHIKTCFDMISVIRNETHCFKIKKIYYMIVTFVIAYFVSSV